MKNLMLALLSIFTLSNVAQAETKISLAAEGLKAFCSNHTVIVTNYGALVYQTSEYWSILGCAEDSAQLKALFIAAQTLHKTISMTTKNSPTTDFQIETDGVHALTVSPENLGIDCISYGDFNTNQRLTVTLNNSLIYESTRYVGHNGCRDAARVVGMIINAARAGGRLVQLKHTNSPDTDFAIAN